MNFILKIVDEVKILILILSLLLVMIGVSPFLLLNYIIRSCVQLLAKIFRPDLDCLVTAEQALMAYNVSNIAHQNIAVCLTLDGSMSTEGIRSVVQKQVFDFENRKEFKYIALKRTWTSFMGWPFWKVDQDFDLKNHIKDYCCKGNLAALYPLDDQEIQRVLGGLLRLTWNRNRSPWELLRYPNEAEKDSTILILRMEHILADGFSILELLRTISKSDFAVPKITLGQRNLSKWETMGLGFKIPYDVVKTYRLAVGASGLKQIGNVDVEMASVSPVVDVGVIKRIKDHYSVSYAAVIYSAIFGAIERALRKSGLNVPEYLVTSIVVPRRNHPGGMCIHADVLLAKLPVRCKSSAERLLKIQRNLIELSHSAAPFAQPYIARLLGSLPMILRRSATNWAFNMSLAVTVSSFPVTASLDYMETHAFRELIALTSTIPQVGVVVTAGGLNNKQKFGFAVGTSVFPKEVIQDMGKYATRELQALIDGSV